MDDDRSNIYKMYLKLGYFLYRLVLNALTMRCLNSYRLLTTIRAVVSACIQYRLNKKFTRDYYVFYINRYWAAIKLSSVCV